MRKEVQKAYSPITFGMPPKDNKLSCNSQARHEPEVLMNNRANIIGQPFHDWIVQ